MRGFKYIMCTLRVGAGIRKRYGRVLLLMLTKHLLKNFLLPKHNVYLISFAGAGKSSQVFGS